MKTFGLTIDAQGSKDLDDAIWAIETNSGYEVFISVTDVAKHVSINSDIDILASNKSLNIYTDTNRITMLPENLTQQLTLLPKQNRDVLVLRVNLDSKGNILNYHFYQDNFRSLSKLSYDKVENIIKDKSSRLNPIMINCAIVASMLWKKRVPNIAILNDWNTAFDMEGNVLPNIKEGDLAQSIVHEFMILTNVIATDFLSKNNYNMIYRNQVPRPGERSGRYEVIPKGHYGLGVNTYGHFTSPMRRYVDLVNQRILISAIRKEPSPYDITKLSEYCAQSNVAFQKADIINKTSQGNFQIPVSHGLESLKKMDSIAFSKIISSFSCFDKHIFNEYIRRRDTGLLNINDIAKLLFSQNSPLKSNGKAELLGLLKNTERMPSKVWQVAKERNLLPCYESEIKQIDDNKWMSNITLGKYTSIQYGEDYDQVRDISILKLMSCFLGIEPLEMSSKLLLIDIKSEKNLEILCKQMGWKKPEYKVSAIKSDEYNDNSEVVYQGFVVVKNNDYTFTSPIAFSKSKKGIKQANAENALSNLKPYVNNLMKQQYKKNGVNISLFEQKIEKNEYWSKLQEFCIKYLLDYKIMWLKESQYPEFVECQLEIKYKDIILDSIGYGNNRFNAREMAASKLISLITGVDHDLENETWVKIS
jgi:hypothetical protein